MSVDTRSIKEYKSDLRPIWCPGCGDFGVLNSFFKALRDINLTPHKVAVMSGIGCSGRFPAFCSAYGFHGVHGRALPLATGVKLANPELTVFAIAGDGDCFSIGAGHLPHAARRNIDITLLVLDNEIYGLTKGQASPTSPLGTKRKSSPYGTVEHPTNPLAMALAYDCGFVARAFTSQAREMTEIIKKAILHKGFSFVQCMSPCVTFFDNYAAWKKKAQPLPSTHDTSNKIEAFKYALDTGSLHIGVFYEDNRPSYDAQLLQIRERATKENPLELSTYAESFRC